MTFLLGKNGFLILLLTAFFVSSGFINGSEVIQTQESDAWDGVEVDLTYLKIKDDIITLRFKIKNTGTEIQDIKLYFKDCYIMDETNQKKYFVLKDADGQYIGGPKDKDWEGGRFSSYIDSKVLVDNDTTITIEGSYTIDNEYAVVGSEIVYITAYADNSGNTDLTVVRGVKNTLQTTLTTDG